MSKLHAEAGPRQRINENAARAIQKQRRDKALERQWPGRFKNGFFQRVNLIKHAIEIDAEFGGKLDKRTPRALAFVRIITNSVAHGCAPDAIERVLRKIMKQIGASTWIGIDKLIADTKMYRSPPYTEWECGEIIGLTYEVWKKIKAGKRMLPIDKTLGEIKEIARRDRNARAKQRRADHKPPPTKSERVDALMAETGVSRATAYRRLGAGKRVSKAPFVKMIMEKAGVGRTTAYELSKGGRWAAPRRIPLTRSKPWVEAGFNNRRTWERHGKPEKEGCRNFERRLTAGVASPGQTQTPATPEIDARSNVYCLHTHRDGETKVCRHTTTIQSGRHTLSRHRSMPHPSSQAAQPSPDQPAPSRRTEGLAFRGEADAAPAPTTGTEPEDALTIMETDDDEMSWLARVVGSIDP